VCLTRLVPARGDGLVVLGHVRRRLDDRRTALTGSADGVPEDRGLYDRIARIAEKHGPVLEASGAPPPGECAPVDCLPPSTSTSPYEFQDDGAYERCPDGRSVCALEDRCLREPSGACAIHRVEKTPCPR
jgi:hypothetical protein